jgi:hypothetical protein
VGVVVAVLIGVWVGSATCVGALVTTTSMGVCDGSRLGGCVGSLVDDDSGSGGITTTGVIVEALVLGAETGYQDGMAVGTCAEGSRVKRVDIGANVVSMGNCVVLVPKSIVVGTMGAMLVGDSVLASGVMVGAWKGETEAVK